MHLDYSLTPKTVFQALTGIIKKLQNYLFYVGLIIFGSKSSQIASIFHEKNFDGV